MCFSYLQIWRRIYWTAEIRKLPHFFPSFILITTDVSYFSVIMLSLNGYSTNNTTQYVTVQTCTCSNRISFSSTDLMVSARIVPLPINAASYSNKQPILVEMLYQLFHSSFHPDRVGVKCSVQCRHEWTSPQYALLFTPTCCECAHSTVTHIHTATLWQKLYLRWGEPREPRCILCVHHAGRLTDVSFCIYMF